MPGTGISAGANPARPGTTGRTGPAAGNHDMKPMQAWHNWRERHRHPASVALHAVGIPMTVLAVGLAAGGKFGWAAGLFVGGYLLQFLGHAIEGNDAGEVVLIKRLLGRPYVAIAPRRKGSAEPDDPAGND